MIFGAVSARIRFLLSQDPNEGAEIFDGGGRLGAKGLSQNELAKQSGLARMRISEIVRGRRKITNETAIALGKALDMEPPFWLNLQRDYDLAVEAQKSRGLTARARSLARAASATPTKEWPRQDP